MTVSRAILWVALFTLTATAGKAQEATPPASSDADSPASCSKSLLFNFQRIHDDGEAGPEIPIWQVSGGSAFFYEAGMSIDADGAPNAYNPDDTGIDDLDNAGEPGHWWALALDENGEPYIQGDDDPFPGYYVSTTALADREKDGNDPGRFVDASMIPYIVLPGSVARETGARLGDFAMVLNRANGKVSYAIYADEGPSVGEGSVALAENLGVRSDARRGGALDNIRYFVFPGSGNGKPRSVDEINEETEKLLGDSDADAVKGCTEAY